LRKPCWDIFVSAHSFSAVSRIAHADLQQKALIVDSVILEPNAGFCRVVVTHTAAFV